MLDALSSRGLRFAFLHREAEAAAGTLASDYDLAVDGQDAASVVRAALSALAETGLRPVMASEYDAGSVTLWLTTPTADEGVQVDFTYDTGTANQLALPLGAWVETSTPGVRWPRVIPEQEAQYRTRKAALKAGGWSPRPTPARVVAEGRRLGRRLRSPAGFWVNVQRLMIRDEAEELAARFARFLPTVRTIELGPARPALSWTRRPKLVAPVRYRPGLLVTHSSMTHQPHADFTIDSLEGRNVDAMADALTRVMADRLERRYAVV